MIYLIFIPFMLLFIIAFWPFLATLAMGWVLLLAALVAGHQALAVIGICFVVLALVWRHPTRNLGNMLYRNPKLPPPHRCP